MKKLKIAQLVLPWIALPPKKYAGVEKVVYNLTEELVKRGHDVTLFSVGESQTSAQLEYIIEKEQGYGKDILTDIKTTFYPLMHVSHCFEMQNRFDIIHSHAHFFSLPFAAISKTPSVHTFHQVYDVEHQDEKDMLKKYSYLNFTSISNAQRIPNLNYIATVYNGIDTNKYIPKITSSYEYIFWTARLVKEKGAKEAIEVSRRLKKPLIIAGKISDVQYFKSQIEPELDNRLITFFPEVDEHQIIDFYQNARVVLTPLKWNEPFGLVPVESLACGTPVVGYMNGGQKETLKDGVTGFCINEKNDENNLDFIVKKSGLEGLCEGVERIFSLSADKYKKMRETSRSHVEKNFTIEKMVDDYEKVYEKILNP